MTILQDRQGFTLMLGQGQTPRELLLVGFEQLGGQKVAPRVCKSKQMEALSVSIAKSSQAADKTKFH